MRRARPKNAKKTKEIKIEASKQEELIKESVNEAENESYESIINEIQNEKRSRKKLKKKKKKKPLGTKFAIVFVILAAVLVVFMGMNHFDDDELLSPLENGKINVLMLGVDESGLRADAIMLASYDVNEGEINLLSIPRDTKIKVENKNATKKINGIHAMSTGDNSGQILGVQAMAEAVTTLTGMPVNYYVEFSFLSIDHLFDILGPVEFDVPDVEGKGRGMNYDDPYQNLHIHLEPGLQKLSGNQVQQFLRYRKSNYHVGTGSDTDRVKRQQDFIKAVIDQKVNASVILKLPSIYTQLSKEIKTNISMGDVTSYIRYVKKLSGDKIHSFSLPGEAKMLGGASYFVCNLAETQKLMGEVFGSDETVSDKVNLSGKNPQKPLKAGNMSSQTVVVPNNESNKVETSNHNAEEQLKNEENEPESEPVPEPEVNEIPEPEQNDTPLEDIFNLDD